MKIKAVYLASALLLMFSLVSVIVPAGPAMAAEDEIWVDDDYTAATPGWGTTHFDNLKDGIGNTSFGGTVHVAPGTYEADDIAPNKALTITGAGAGITIVDGQYDERLFTVDTHTYVISDMTLRHGNTSVWGGGIWNHMGTLIMLNCIISGNIAGTHGGGIYNEGGEVTLTNCTITGNTAGDQGGGIYNWGKLTMTGCTVSGNDATKDGGGIWTSGPQTLTMTNCTISGNTAFVNGGGICNNFDDITLVNCTISGNTADSGGGIYLNSGSLTITCTIVHGNTVTLDGPNVYGGVPMDTSGESIVGSPDPLLGPLQYNGGPTETHALMTGSPAIDACITGCTVNTDQRGLPRPVDGDLDGTVYCDVGAYEKQPAVAVVGGIVEPVDRIGILAPWLALAALTAVALSVVVAMRRRHLT